MPKHFRQCNFCGHNTTLNPDIVIFCVNEHMLSVLDINSGKLFICEAHFDQSDVKTHGNTRRLREGATPVHFPRKEAVLLDHSYVSTGPLNLETEETEDDPDVILRQTEWSEAGLDLADDDKQEDDDDIPVSQNSSILPSSGSLYMPSQGSETSSDNTEPKSQPESEGENLDGSILLVPWVSLLLLLTKCQRVGCADQVLASNMSASRNGAAVTVKMTCNSGHKESWASSRNVGQGKWTMPYINLLIILYSFMTGLGFDKLKAFFDRCHILSISSTTYYRYLKKLVYPVIWSFWLIDQARNLANIMKRGTSVTLCGDARFDSPGFSAKYATYLVQEVESKKIIALEVGMKGQVKSSGQMEVKACERLIKYLVSVGLNIRVFATDRSTTIRTMMAAVYPWIKHQFDIWHFSKGIKKRMFKSFKLVSCPNMKLWQKSVMNMIWWSISSSIGNAPLARQKILSIFHHTANVHTFPAFTLFKKCQHPQIVEPRPWIKAGSFEMKKLRLAILGSNGKNLDDLEMMDEFVHTSDLESLNSLILKYCSKTHSYSWLGMLIRTCLAVLDFNNNIKRKAKTTKDGRTRYKMKVDRTGTKVTVVEQKESKDYSYQENILGLIMECLERGVVPTPEYPIDQEAIRKRKHQFKKDDLVTNFTSRMKKSKD